MFVFFLFTFLKHSRLTIYVYDVASIMEFKLIESKELFIKKIKVTQWNVNMHKKESKSKLNWYKIVKQVVLNEIEILH